MKILFISFSLLLIFIYLSCSGDSPSSHDRDLTFSQKLQKALDDGISTYNGKGVSVAVIMPDGETWKGASGISHGNTIVTIDMLFSAGSITKMFTAATILQLSEEGVLTLEDSLFEWLPAFPNIDSTITIRQLLNHTSGIFNITENQMVWQDIFSSPNNTFALQEVIENYTLAPDFPKGTNWHYSNTGYLLLRMIIIEASGTDIVTQYRTRFFEPLNMNNSYVAPYESWQLQEAQGWFDLDNNGTYDELPFMTSFYSMAGGGVFCTAEDLTIWSNALFHDKVVLTQSSLDQMLDFYLPCPDENLVDGYGLGVVRFTPGLFNGLAVWGHGGDAIGYAAGCFYLTDYDVSFSIMDNTDDGETMWIINDLLDIIITELE